MERNYDHNSVIIFVDPKGAKRPALVTAWWGVKGASYGGEVNGTSPPDHYVSESGEPGCNLVFISGDAKRTDSCGRQTEHATSIVHKSKQPAGGNYWCWPDEI